MTTSQRLITEAQIKDTVIRVVVDDISAMDIEAFVFDIKSDMKLGAGHGGAIAVRGGPSIQEELNQLDKLEVGQAVATTAGNLKASHIIHTVGPKYQEEDEDRKMKDAVMSVLKVADEKTIPRIAFPPMGTGMYFMPLPKSAKLLASSVKEYVESNSTQVKEIVFCMVDEREYKVFAKEVEQLS